MIGGSLERQRRTIIFFRESPSDETVLNWIRDLPQHDRSALGLDLDLVQDEWRAGEAGDADGAPTERVGRVATGLFGGFRKPKQGRPLCRKLDDRIWEMQSAMPSGKVTSLLLFAANLIVHVVHGQIKTASAVPPELLVLARARMDRMIKKIS